MSTPHDIANTLAIAHLVNTLRRAQRAMWQWQDGHPFDMHGEPRLIQRAIEDALAPYDEMDKRACEATFHAPPGDES